MNETLEAASIKSCNAKCDADFPIEVLVTKYATNKATTLVEDYTAVFLMLCYYRQSNTNKNIHKTKGS